VLSLTNGESQSFLYVSKMLNIPGGSKPSLHVYYCPEKRLLSSCNVPFLLR
jgi:hypothetical protein